MNKSLNHKKNFWPKTRTISKILVYSTEKTTMDKYCDFKTIILYFIAFCGLYTIWYFRLQEEPKDC